MKAMPVRRRTLVLAVVTIASLFGCMTPPPTGDGNDNSVDAAGLVPGAYSGDVNIAVEVFVNNVLETYQVTSRRLTETIGPNGLPLLSNGEELKATDTFAILEDSGGVVSARVESIAETDDAVVVQLSIGGSRAGLAVSGTGQTVYDKASANVINFSLNLDYSGQNVAGQIIRQRESQTGQLVR